MVGKITASTGERKVVVMLGLRNTRVDLPQPIGHGLAGSAQTGEQVGDHRHASCFFWAIPVWSGLWPILKQLRAGGDGRSSSTIMTLVPIRAQVDASAGGLHRGGRSPVRVRLHCRLVGPTVGPRCVRFRQGGRCCLTGPTVCSSCGPSRSLVRPAATFAEWDGCASADWMSPPSTAGQDAMTTRKQYRLWARRPRDRHG
jgi:hypothetical protein